MVWPQIFAMVSALSATADLPQGQTPQVTVYGEAEARVAPDFATVNFSLQVEKPSVEEGMSSEDGAVASLLAGLKDEGVAADDVQTFGRRSRNPSNLSWRALPRAAAAPFAAL